MCTCLATTSHLSFHNNLYPFTNETCTDFCEMTSGTWWLGVYRFLRNSKWDVMTTRMRIPPRNGKWSVMNRRVRILAKWQVRRDDYTNADSCERTSETWWLDGCGFLRKDKWNVVTRRVRIPPRNSKWDVVARRLTSHWQSNHLAIKPSSHQTIQPSNHPTIQPSIFNSLNLYVSKK